MAVQSKGYCKYCGKEFTRSGMVRHLASCRERAAANAGKGKTGCYELVIYGKYNSDYWLIVQMKDTETLLDLDQFIRDIWVECCDHLSSFTIGGQDYESLPSKDYFWGGAPKSMNIKLQKVLSAGMLLSYEYDYGSTTELLIKVQRHLEGMNQEEKIIILSRNNPPRILCNKCGKNPAEWINPMNYYEEDAFWCEECLKERNRDPEEEEETEEEEAEEETEAEEYYDFWEYMLPVCNSPRMGVCGYEGSSLYPDQFEPDKKKE